METTYINLKESDAEHNSFAVIAFNLFNEDLNVFNKRLKQAIHDQFDNDPINIPTITDEHIADILKRGGVTITLVFPDEEYETLIELEQTWLYA